MHYIPTTPADLPLDAVQLLHAVGTSMFYQSRESPAEQFLVGIGLLCLTAQGHFAGLRLTDAGRAEFERRWDFKLCR